jgi:hypothetical protein
MTHDVSPEELAGIGREEELEEPLVVARDEAARVQLVVAASDDVVDALLLQLLLGGTHVADLGNRVDREREVRRRSRRTLEAEGMPHGAAALVHRRRRERRIADHVAHGIDVRVHCLVARVHLEEPVGVRGDAQRLQSEVLGVAVASHAVENVDGALDALRVCRGRAAASGNPLDLLGPRCGRSRCSPSPAPDGHHLAVEVGQLRGCRGASRSRERREDARVLTPMTPARARACAAGCGGATGSIAVEHDLVVPDVGGRLAASPSR